MGNKLNKVQFFNDFAASDLLDSHVLGNDKHCEPAMPRSHRSSLDANSVDVSYILLGFDVFCVPLDDQVFNFRLGR